MQKLLRALCLFLLITSVHVHADDGLNPLKWLGFGEKTGEEAELAMDIASAADEATAKSLLLEGKQALQAGNKSRASKRFKTIIKKYGTAQVAGEARYLRARILMTKGKWVKAFETLQEIITENPEYEQYTLVLGAQFECATALMEGARSRIFWVIPGFRQYDQAIEQFEKIVRNGPYSDYAPLALMNIALVAEERNEPDVAIDALDRLINYYPQSMLAPDAYYTMAETYSSLVKGPEYDQGATRQAISYYEDFLILFSESPYLGDVEANLAAMQNLLAKSRLNLGDFFYYYRNNNTAALTFYNEAVTIAPESETAEEARERIKDVEAGVQPVSGARIVRALLLID